ncbi:hypothetical protein DPEC_G00210970 [Dallia pectoralis]|uniref:Uncharacterized protein n=1 Tax=Dallia pectoralis TaxID=75939 RepID=A0ACC2G5T6_DALPE|nr:hypothetical protein DPEC_G00210970 [Dallia pectoralis]
MSSSGTNLHNKRLPSETEHAQRVPDLDAAQQLKLRERQRFFEEVFQHDVDVYLSSAHLQIYDYKRPPLSSISSMEVNVDMLEQMDPIDISDPDSLEVFFSSGGDQGELASSLPVIHNDEAVNPGYSPHKTGPCDGKSRVSSTSSTSSTNSQRTNEDGRNTPVVQSDDEHEKVNALLLM